MRAHTASIVLSLLSLALAAGCGGGGGGGPLPDEAEPFHGTYHMVTIGTSPSTDAFRAAWGTLEATDGDSTATTTWMNDDGAITPIGAVPSETTASVAPGGRWEWRDPLDPDPSPLAAGALSSDGDIGILAIVREGYAPGLIVLLRRSGTHALSSLQGSWTEVAYGDDHASDAVFGLTGVIDFDTGDWERTYALNAGGVVLPSLGTLAGTYTVSPAGSTRMVASALPVFGLEGGVLADGSAALIGGGSEPTNPGFLGVHLPTFTGGTDALFAGTYRVVGLERLVLTNQHAGYEGTLTSDGAGNYSITVLRNGPTGVTGPTTDTGTYDVQPNGQFGITTSGGITMQGGITSDGRFATLGGPVTNLTNPRIWLILRP